ncbi:MAG: hypothetical protein ACRDGM_14035, partial [bacterium]
MIRRLGMLTLLLCALFGSPATVNAQEQAPQPRYYIGEGQVDLYRGGFLYSNTDIAVGSGPGALSLQRFHGVRAYGMGPFGSTTGHSQEVMVYRERFVEDPWGPPNYSFRWHVVIGRTVEVFDDPFMQGGSAISYQGANPGYHNFTRQSTTGPFTYYGPHGLVINFPALGY